VRRRGGRRTPKDSKRPTPTRGGQTAPRGGPGTGNTNGRGTAHTSRSPARKAQAERKGAGAAAAYRGILELYFPVPG